MATDRVGQVSVEVIADARNLSKSVEKSLSGVFTNIDKQAQQALGKVEKAFEKSGKATGDALAKPLQTATSAYDEFVKKTVPRVSAAQAAILGSTGKLTKGAEALRSSFGEALAPTLWDKFKSSMSTATSAVTNGVQGMVNKAKTTLQTGFTAVSTAFAKTIDVPRQAWGKFTQSLPRGVTQAAGDIAGAFQAVGGRLSSMWSSVTGGMSTMFANGMSSAGKSVTQLGEQFGKLQSPLQGVGGALTKYITTPILGAITAAAGLVGVLGFKRLTGIDQARGQFQGLGYDAEAVMKQVDQGVTNTSLSMAQGASAAVGILATGSVPLEDLGESIQRVANISAAYNVDAEQAAYLMNNILTKNKVTWGDLSQMQMNQIPVVTALADHYGVAGDAIMDMAQNGQISIEDLNEALDSKAGAAAEAYAGTWNGITANIRANLGKLGAKLMEPSFEILKDKAQDLLTFLQSGELADWATRTGEAFGALFTLIGDGDYTSGLREGFGWAEDSKVVDVILTIRDGLIGMRDAWAEMSPEAKQTVGIIAGVAVAAGPALAMLGKVSGVLSSIFGFFGPLMSSIGGAVTAAGGIGPALGGAFSKVGGALKGLFGPVGIIVGLIAGMIASSPELREALGGAFESIMGILGTLFETLAPVIDQIFEAAVPILEKLGDMFAKLVEAIMPVVQTLADALMPVIELVLGLVQPLLDIILAIVDPLISLAGIVIDLVTPFIEWGAAMLGLGIEKLADWLSSWLVPAIEWVSDALETVIGWFKSTGEEGSEASNWLTEAWGNVSQFFTDLWDGVVDVFETAIDWIVNAFLNFTPLGLIIQHWDTIVDFFQGIWDGVVAVFQWAWDVIILPIFQAVAGYIDTFIIQPFNFLRDTVTFIWDVIASATAIMWDAVAFIFQQVWDWISAKLAPIFTWLGDTVNTVWTNVSTWIGNAWTTISGIFTAIRDAIRNTLAAAFTWFRDSVIKPVWQWIQDRINQAKSFLDQMWRGISDGIRNVLAIAFTWLRDNVIKPVWDGIQNVIRTVSDWFQDTVVTNFQKATDAVGDAFEKARDVIQDVWDAIKKAAVAPVNFVINTVYRGGIKKLFDDLAKAVGSDVRMPAGPNPIKLASGGVLPGYTPGRDVHKFFSPTGGNLWLSGGEAIMRPEFVKAVGGPGGVAALNRAVRTGAIGGQQHAQGGIAKFAGGGIWDGLVNTVSGVGDWISSAAENIGNVLANPADAIKNLILEPIKALLADIGGGSVLGKVLTDLPLKAIDWISDWFKDFASSQQHGDYKGGLTLARVIPVLARYPSLGITSTYRTPAENAAVGGAPQSYHMDYNNPAVDVAGPWGAMDAFAAELRKIGGWRQLLWQVAGHYDHVHVANQGGIFGDLPRRQLYDSGGWLQPGMTMAYNASGQREAVLTADEIALIKAMVAQGAKGTTIEEGAIQIRGSIDTRRTALDVLDAITEESSR